MGPEPRSSSITGAADRSLAYTGARARLTVSELHGVPVVLLTHLAAVLDNWDPRVVDCIAAKHRVITFAKLKGFKGTQRVDWQGPPIACKKSNSPRFFEA